MAPHDPQQRVEIQWFRESGHGAESARARFGVRRARHDGDRNARDVGVPELRTPEFRAAQTRHREIQKHQAGNVGSAVLHRAKQVQRLEAVFCGHNVEACGREETHDHLARVKIVFDDEDVAGDGHVIEATFKSRTAPFGQKGSSAGRAGLTRSRGCVPRKWNARPAAAPVAGEIDGEHESFTVGFQLSAECAKEHTNGTPVVDRAH